MTSGLQRTPNLIYKERAMAGHCEEMIRSASAINHYKGTAQIETITVTAAANGDSITIAKTGFPSVVVTLNATTGASVGAARDALLTALKQNYRWYSYFDIVASSTAAITMTDRTPSVVTAVSTFTGSAGTTTGTLTITTTAAAAVATPYGLVVARDSSYGYTAGVMNVSVPADSNDVVQGVVIASHVPPTIGFGASANSNPILQTFDILKQGVIWAVTEAAITAEDTALFYRHTANGALATLGAIAPATGTGLAALTSAVSKGASVTLDDGTMVTPIYLDLA